MPANLPPQYIEVIKKYGKAKIPQRKLVYLQELLTIVAKHKGAGKLQNANAAAPDYPFITL